MDHTPEKIEAYDISNISGTDNVGGMVVFQGGKPDKKAYRRFKIKSVDGQNDYASMQEMIFRRIERGIKEQNEGKDPEKSSFLPFPDVFCIDGGKTHVDAVRSILQMYPNAVSYTHLDVYKRQIHVIDCARAGADIATVPFGVIMQMTKHPLTDQGIEKFQADYKAVFGEQ